MVCLSYNYESYDSHALFVHLGEQTSLQTHDQTLTCVHTRDYTRPLAHARTHSHTHTHKRARTHAHTQTHTHAHTHTHTHAHSHTHKHTHTQTHTHTNTHTHTHTHTLMISFLRRRLPAGVVLPPGRVFIQYCEQVSFTSIICKIACFQAR
jgi:hypothetical protein